MPPKPKVKLGKLIGKIVFRTFLAVVIGAIVLLVHVYRMPDDFTISRKVVIVGTPDKVFEHVNNLHKWNDWSPWIKSDSDSAAVFSGPESGYGASMSWAGGPQVGEGRMTLTKSVPTDNIFFTLDVNKPFPMSSTEEFHFMNQGENTVVSWTIYGVYDFKGKFMSVFFDPDRLVGRQFEQGLINLKDVVEKE